MKFSFDTSALQQARSIVTVSDVNGRLIGLGSRLAGGGILAHVSFESAGSPRFSGPLQIKRWSGALETVHFRSTRMGRNIVYAAQGVVENDEAGLEWSTERMAVDRSLGRCFCYHLGTDRLSYFEVEIDSVDVVAPGVCVYRLEGNLSTEAAGSPLLGADGKMLGMVMSGRSKGQARVFGIPARDLRLEIESQQAPSEPATAPKEPLADVPRAAEHPLSLLDGSTVEGLAAVNSALVGAIRIGAPAFNQGEIETCFRLYSQTALKLIEARPDCPGVQRALRDGLLRAQSLKEAPQRAWAMRDTFDGLIAVINRFFESAPLPPKLRGPQSLN
jgi:hypothetical protein